MTTGDDATSGVAPAPPERDPDLPHVILDLSSRTRRTPPAPAVDGEPATEPILMALAQPLADPTASPIGMPPRHAPAVDPTTAKDAATAREAAAEADPQPGAETGMAGEPAAGRAPGGDPAAGAEPTAAGGSVADATGEILDFGETATLPIGRPDESPTLPLGPGPRSPVASAVRDRLARGRARVYPRLRRRTATVVGHRRRWGRRRLRMWEAATWIAALGVVAAMAGFVIRAAPMSQPFVAGAGPTLSPANVVAAPSCVLRGCPHAYPPGPPTRLRIPTIGVDSGLESLVLDGHGVLTPPDRFDEAGWFARGVVPGDPGPAVIAGHVDSSLGPGVFFRLRQVRPGAEVSVQRGGAWVTFRVTEVETYPKDQFPAARVYGPTPDPELRVITCGGDFDTVHGRYYDNVVVYAVLAS